MTREETELYNLYLQMDKEVLAKTLAIIMSNKGEVPNVQQFPIWPYQNPYIFPNYQPLTIWYTTSNLKN